MAGGATAARRAALEIVTATAAGELADRALARHAAELDSRDRAWVQELVYGTFRLRGRIDHILAAHVRGGLERVAPPVLEILRLGAYQLLEMGGVPPYAAVSQSVELTRAVGEGRASGFVNGVLQSVHRGAGQTAFPALNDAPVEHLATWGSHPRWLVERWVARWGAEAAAQLVESDNTRPDLFFRPVGMSGAEAIERFQAAGIEASAVEGFPDSVRMPAGANPTEVLAAVPGVIQDPAAATVTRFAAFDDGSVVIDLCAAPGGKTAGVADRAGFVAASDLSLGRMRRVRSNVERSGVATRVGLVVADGRSAPFRAVDGVLIDAPCTGTGTLRRHPDGRWRLKPEDLAALAALQGELLREGAKLVRPGGVLVYATCSVEPAENEEQVSRFLEAHPEFRLASPSDEVLQSAGVLRDGVLQVLPQIHGVDGAFAARMERTE